MTRVVLGLFAVLFAVATLWALETFTGLQRSVFAAGSAVCLVMFVVAIIHPDTKGRP